MLYASFPSGLSCLVLQHLKTQCAAGRRALQPKDGSAQEPEQLSPPAQVPDPISLHSSEGKQLRHPFKFSDGEGSRFKVVGQGPSHFIPLF